MEQAIAINETSLKWDGISAVDPDGTVHFAQDTSKALFKLLGQKIETLTVANAEAQANSLLAAL